MRFPFPRRDLVDRDDASLWDAEADTPLPESAFGLSPQQALQLSDMIRSAAETALLFQDAPDGAD
jgi:hypothetical protein